MIVDVKKRLESFGCVITDNDDWPLNFIIEKVQNYIKDNCNVPTIPDGLHHVAVDMVCGEFLTTKKATGQLNEFDLEAAVKTIKEGDTTVTFATGEGSSTPEERLNGFISYLLNYGKPQFVTYRSVKW